jgi:hypothetical protein
MTTRLELRAKHHELMRRYVRVAASLLPTDVGTFDFYDPQAVADLDMALAELAKIQSAMDEVVSEARYRFDVGTKPD